MAWLWEMNPPTLPGFVRHIDMQIEWNGLLIKRMCCKKTKFESKLSYKQEKPSSHIGDQMTYEFVGLGQVLEA